MSRCIIEVDADSAGIPAECIVVVIERVPPCIQRGMIATQRRGSGPKLRLTVIWNTGEISPFRSQHPIPARPWLRLRALYPLIPRRAWDSGIKTPDRWRLQINQRTLESSSPIRRVLCYCPAHTVESSVRPVVAERISADCSMFSSRCRGRINENAAPDRLLSTQIRP